MATKVNWQEHDKRPATINGAQKFLNDASPINITNQWVSLRAYFTGK